jgi:Tfp pilus assembly protein PilN
MSMMVGKFTAVTNLKLDLNAWWHRLSNSLKAGNRGLGVYLDGTGLTLMHLQKDFSGFQVLNLFFLPVEEGGVGNLAPRLREIVADWALEACPVSLAVSVEIGFFRQAALPRAAAENLPQVVAYELDRFLPLAADKLYYDFQVLQETDKEITLHLMALSREKVESCLLLLTEVGLKPMSLELAPTAAANAFAVLAGKLPASWLLLHLESGGFQLAQVQGQALGGFFIRSNLAAKEFSKALAAELSRPGVEGWDPKALCLYGRSGAGLDLAALGKGQGLDMVYPNHLAVKELPAETEYPGVLPALGAALKSLGKVPLAANLLPLTERAAPDFGVFSLTKVLLGVFLGLCLLWVGSALVHQRFLLYRVNRQIAALAPEAKQVEKQLEESRTLAKQMESLAKIGQSPDKLKILKDLTTLVPDNTWLFNLRLSKQNLEISGMSRSASDLIPLLEKSGWLKKTEFASPIVTDANKLEHFKIKAEIKGLEPAS